MTDLLVIAPHPDDEILGCGATMARYLREGKSVRVFYVGEGCFPESDGLRTIAAALVALGEDGDMNFYRTRDYKDADQRFELHSRADMADMIAEKLDLLQPTTILLPFWGDVNLDHRVVYEAAMVACRPTRDFIETVMCYETASSTEWGGREHPFVPDTWVEVSNEDLVKKENALDVYRDQMKPHPHPRGVEAACWKAKTRGREVCAYHAEAFMTVRKVVRL
jgi:LmbE family N-acetylglucosaminyl deacetylase